MSFRPIGPRRIPSRRRPVTRAALLVCGLMVVLGVTASAQPVPEKTQLPIFFKLLTYDRVLWDDAPGRLTIGLLHRPEDERSQANLTAMIDVLTASTSKTINGVPFDFLAIGWGPDGDLAARLDASDVDVLYVTDGHGDVLDQVSAASRRLGLLTLSARAAWVDDGLALGIGLDAGRPRIIVNLAAVEAEGHELDSRVLRLCKVVGR
ncbi:DUF4154 domain-containing protein [bacterium]|nr:DUF4154 domain-containing protein [bacterium]